MLFIRSLCRTHKVQIQISGHTENKPTNDAYGMKELNSKKASALPGFEDEFEALGEKPRSLSKLDTTTLILDVGCGTKPKGTVNVDVSRKGVNKQIEEQNNEVSMSAKANNFVLAHGEYLPFEDEIFDVVYSSHAIEHTQNPILMLKEMYRLAKRKVIVKCHHRKGGRAKNPALLNYFDENYFQQASRLLGLKASSFVTRLDRPVSSKIEMFFPQKLKPFISENFAWRTFQRIERVTIKKGVLAFPCEMEVWISKNQKSSNCDKIVFVVCYNVPYIYRTRFLSSPYTSQATIEANHNTKTTNEALPIVFNRVVKKYLHEDAWLAFCHQDFILNEDLNAKLKDKVPGVYGVIGASYGYETFIGQITRTNGSLIGKRLENIHPVQTLDEMCIIVHSSLFRAGLRFDERFDFHFYGADLCMEAYRRGFDVYAMQVDCQHKAARYKSKALTGTQDTESFCYCLKRFKEKWKNFLPIRTTTKLMV